MLYFHFRDLLGVRSHAADVENPPPVNTAGRVFYFHRGRAVP